MITERERERARERERERHRESERDTERVRVRVRDVQAMENNTSSGKSFLPFLVPVLYL